MYRSTNQDLTPQERMRTSFLMVEQDRGERQNLKQLMGNLGYVKVSDTGKHSMALQRLSNPENEFTHVIFDARPTDMNPADFLKVALETAPHLVCIPCSSNPNLDDVFQLLVNGARGFLLKPFTLDAIDTSIIVATKGEPLSASVKEAKDRNDALASIVMNTLNKVAEVHKQVRIFPAVEKELPRFREQLLGAMDLARMFAKGGDDGLLAAIESYCIERSKGPSTKLGRLRKRIKERSHSEGETGSEQDSTAEDDGEE